VRAGRRGRAAGADLHRLPAGTTSNARAVARGLRFRPVGDTARDTLVWLDGGPRTELLGWAMDPRQREQPQRSPGPTPGDVRRRALVVDDNRDAADLLAELLERAGFEVAVAYDGPGALTAIEAELPEVAILDLGLPGMDGYELAAALRADRRLARLRLVALSGYSADADRKRAERAGFDRHLVKPVNLAALTTTLDALLS
jgi:YD repeat-containing protein